MTSTRNQAFSEIRNKGGKRNEVLSVIRYMGGATLFEITEILKWPVNCVTGRVNELCKDKVVKNSGKVKKNPKTNRSAIVWVLHG